MAFSKIVVIFVKSKHKQFKIMGQRLAIRVKQENKTQAIALYQWSGNTKSAMQLVTKALESRWLGNPLANAIETLQGTGAGFLEENHEKIAEVEWQLAFMINTVTNRDDGVIAIDHDTMVEFDDRADHIVTIDCDNMTVDFDLFFNSEYLDDEEETTLPADIKEIDIDHTNIPFNRWDEFVDFVSENPLFVDATDTGDEEPVVWRHIL